MKRYLISVVLVVLGVVPAIAQNVNANSKAFQASMAHFNANARALGLTNPSAELKARTSLTDGLGQSHIRFDQYFNGVRVFEGEAISHVDGKGRVSVTNALRGNLNVSTVPAVSEATATSKALAGVKALGGTTASAVLRGGGRSRR